MSHRLPEPADSPAASGPPPGASPGPAPGGHTHAGHVHATGPVENLARYSRPAVVGLLVLAALATVIGAILLWPSHAERPLPIPFQAADGGPIRTVDATVISQSRADCGTLTPGTATTAYPAIAATGGPCIASVTRLTSGAQQGQYVVLSIATNRTQTDDVPGQPSTKGLDPNAPMAGQPDLHLDDHLRLSVITDPSGTLRYAFYDYQRGTPLIWWALAFVVAVVAVATWRGLRAVIGLVFAFGVLGYFTLPSILDGHSVVGVALVSSAAILFPVLYLAHGVNMRTSSALLGTVVSLILAAGLSQAAVTSLSLTGLSGESTRTLQLYQGSLSLSGLLLAGFVIGTLGVLNDVTITQASTTFELAAAAGQSRLGAFRGAMRVGRDHIASTVYTLVFAYAGSALPLLLLFSVAGQPFSSLLTGEEVAIELARTFVGGIALALSVPFTTAIAAALIAPPSPESGVARP
ncbi:YibE/F family protein [Gordonia sp. PP30]|uniref:YibE/F family protein n=1 Tax=unclassified Gordonia (in: high G+C Gram-positive bacteria) TaxID=2657482 RepID=UPI002000085D|nr:YibE/F family protein [Gordonia sp. PP30]UQE76016.1 YibE/F family protein [Gordonia sp. PP30]